MASLLGKADSTLVQGAFNAALADVPHDLSDVYDTQAETMKSFMKDLTAAWDSLNSEYNDLENALTDKGATVFDNVTSGVYNDHALKAVHDATNGIKDRLKLQKKDLKGLESQKIQAEMNRFATNTAKNNTTFTALADLSANKGFIIDPSTSDETALLDAIFDDFNNNTNKTNITYKNGDFTYTLGDVTMTMSELDKALTRKDGTQPIAIQGVLNQVLTDGRTKKREVSEDWKNDTKNKIKGSLVTKSDRTNVMHHNFEGLEFTFYEALTGNDTVLKEQIYSALEELGTDIDGDDIPDTKETYLDVGNAVALQKAILNDDGMDDLIAGFLTNNLFDDMHERGVKEIKDKTETATQRNARIKANNETLKLQNEQRRSNENNARINIAIAEKEFGTINDANRRVKLSDDGKYYVMDGMNGSTKLDQRMVLINDPNVDQVLMNHYNQGDNYVTYVTQEEIAKQQEEIAKQQNEVTDRKAMIGLGGITKEKQGDFTKYMAGIYPALPEASTRLAEVKSAGFKNAIIIPKLDGERITLEQAKEVMRGSVPSDFPNLNYEIQLKVGKDINLEMTEAEKLINQYK